MNPKSILLPAAPEELGLSSAAFGRAARVLGADIARGRLPGAVVLVARHGRTAWFESLGVRDPAARDAMQRDSIFRIYSMTKPIVSLATMMLVEEGRLLLSDPIDRYLPEFAAPSVGIERDGQFQREPIRQPITVQDLLRHTSGLTYEFLGDAAVQRMYTQARVMDRNRSNAELSAALAAVPLMYQPGTRWEYSRSTDVLGRLLEVVDGRSLGELLTERIFAPLAMHDTAFRVPPDKHHRIAEPFSTDPDTGSAVRLIDVRSPAAFESGGGGLVSTASDYARFLQLMLDGGTLDGARLVSRKTVEWMTADHLGALPAPSPLLPAGHGFGLGFAVRLADGLAPWPGSVGQYYWGGIGGTTFWVDPRERLIALMLTQAPGQRDHYRQLIRSLVHAAYTD